MQIKTLASGSSGNAYWVSDGTTSLLLECGIPIKQIRKGVDYGLSYFAGCLVSHSHDDHCHAAKDIIDTGVPLYASVETWAGLPQGSPYQNMVAPGHLYTIGTWIVQPFAVEHDVPGALGFVCDTVDERLVYLTDTAYCRFKFPRTTHWMIEANYDIELVRKNIGAGIVEQGARGRLVSTHMSIQTCKELLLANDLSMTKEVHLLHLSSRNADSASFKRTIQEATGCPTYIAGED
jgi:phosphoribosyl 1,2-cyclic phosphodiesterase